MTGMKRRTDSVVPIVIVGVKAAPPTVPGSIDEELDHAVFLLFPTSL